MCLMEDDSQRFSPALLLPNTFLQMSGTIKLMLENLGVADGKSSDDDVIPLANVTAPILRKVPTSLPK